MTLSIDVIGLPAPQGSKRHVGNGVMVESSKAVKTWRTEVAQAAAGAWHGNAPMDGPLCLTVTFRFPMPSSRPKALRVAGIGPKVSAPDLDKCVRAVCDALTAAGVIRDDARIVSIAARKYEVIGWTGAQISVEEL